MCFHEINQGFSLPKVPIRSIGYIDHLRVLRADTERNFIGENLKREIFSFFSVITVFSQYMHEITAKRLTETQLMIVLVRWHLRARNPRKRFR